MKIGILGQGEVGKSIKEVVDNGKHQVFVSDLLLDTPPLPQAGYLDVLHICIPYSDTFIETVVKTALAQRVDLLIIESTVPVGTTRKIAERCKYVKVAHSPIRGNHPNLASSIKTFTKFVSGPFASEAASYYAQFGINTQVVAEYEESELAKLACTTYYAWNIIYCKEVKKACDKLGLNFDSVYTKWNRTYNAGYEAMNRNEVKRAVLKPVDGPIGGHCVIPNTKLLHNLLPDLTEFIWEKNG